MQVMTHCALELVIGNMPVVVCALPVFCLFTSSSRLSLLCLCLYLGVTFGDFLASVCPLMFIGLVFICACSLSTLTIATDLM